MLKMTTMLLHLVREASKIEKGLYCLSKTNTLAPNLKNVIYAQKV